MHFTKKVAAAAPLALLAAAAPASKSGNLVARENDGSSSYDDATILNYALT
jgi:hypothetical protein